MFEMLARLMELGYTGSIAEGQYGGNIIVLSGVGPKQDYRPIIREIGTRNYVGWEPTEAIAYIYPNGAE